MATRRRTRRRNPVDYIFDPMRLVHRALTDRFIDVDTALDPRVQDYAEQIADRWTFKWPEGEGFGSSDFTYALKDFLDGIGVSTHFVDGQLTKKNPRRRRSTRRRNSIGADAMFYALQSKRIPWSQFSTDQLRAVMADAAAHGDTALYNRAKAALARRTR